MMQWGKEAALDALNNGYSMTRQWTGTASNGLIIEGYARNGEVTTFYPKSW